MEKQYNSEITISVKEYKELLMNETKVQFFERFVNGQRYSIDKKDIANIFNFELNTEE